MGESRIDAGVAKRFPSDWGGGYGQPDLAAIAVRGESGIPDSTLEALASLNPSGCHLQGWCGPLNQIQILAKLLARLMRPALDSLGEDEADPGDFACVALWRGGPGDWAFCAAVASVQCGELAWEARALPAEVDALGDARLSVIDAATSDNDRGMPQQWETLLETLSEDDPQLAKASNALLLCASQASLTALRSDRAAPASAKASLAHLLAREERMALRAQTPSPKASKARGPRV